MKQAFIIVTLFLFVTSVAWTQDFTDEEKVIIERGAQLKVESYIKSVQQECKRRAIERALVIVDSLMRTEGLNTRIAPVKKPTRPERPMKPPVKQIPDTLKLDSVRRNNEQF